MIQPTVILVSPLRTDPVGIVGTCPICNRYCQMQFFVDSFSNYWRSEDYLKAIPPGVLDAQFMSCGNKECRQKLRESIWDPEEDDRLSEHSKLVAAIQDQVVKYLTQG